MWLRTLRLENFRNYESLEIDLQRGLNFLHGPNGSGKTSVLEAVSYLAVARSLRSAADGEVVRWGESGFGVAGEIERNGRSERIVLRYARGSSKEVTVDGESIGRLADLVGHLRVAWFSPEDTWITKGGPDARRRLLDVMLCQVDAGYLAALAGYRRALRQRNEALLNWAPDDESDRVVDTWTQKVLDYGSRVVAGRARAVPRLDQAVRGLHEAIAGEDTLELRYRSSVDLSPLDVRDDAGEPISEERNADDGAESEARVRELFEGALEACRADERRRGFTLVGPHRDDLEVRLGGRLLRSFGSQGQHRTAAIALKLGEAAVLDSDDQGVVVLLDDVLSELDGRRGAALVRHIGRHGQALVTSTTRAPGSVASDEGAAFFYVDGGKVVRE